MSKQTTNDLQQALSEFDAQVAISIRANGAPWTVETLASAFERQGLVRREGGCWVMSDGDDGMLFSVLSAPLPPSPAARLILIMDVPQTSPGKNAFGIMTACAFGLASQLGGTLVDDGNQPLSESALAQVADQVAKFYADMEGTGLVPGSPLALRLFGRDEAAVPACRMELLK